MVGARLCTMAQHSAGLVNELVEAKHQLQLRSVLVRWSRYDLIAIDLCEVASNVEPGAESPARWRSSEAQLHI